MRIWIPVLVLIGASLPLSAGDEKPDPAPGTAVEGLEKFGGSPAALKKLLRDGFVATDETKRQISSFYVFRSPAFVTTDALLFAYGWNVQGAVEALERKQAVKLLRVLEGLRKKLEALRDPRNDKSLDALSAAGRIDPSWVTAAEAIDRVLLVALALASGKTEPHDLEALDEKEALEIRLVLGAKEPSESPVRGVPIDYTRFRPRGLYAGDPVLERFHRAVTWLREIPFRVGHDRETREALILVKLDPGYGEDSLVAWNQPYLEFLGPHDDLGIEEYRRASRDHFGFEGGYFPDLQENWKALGETLRALPDPRHTTVLDRDAIREPSKYKGLRLLPRPTLFDNDVFASLFPFGLDRPPVSGEERMAALGCPAAERIVTARAARTIPGYADLLANARESAEKAEKRFDTRLCRARRALTRTLLSPLVDDTLPSWYRHPDWRYKDLNTALAGWARFRHTWDLHGKRNASYGGRVSAPAGVVEPNLSFFKSLLDLTVFTDRFFRDQGVNHTRFADLASLLAELRTILEKQLAGKELDEHQVALFRGFGPRLGRVCGFEGNSWLVDEGLPDASFCVPVTVDVQSWTERVVGQARPRAFYVIVEKGGRKFLTFGAVLSYRDFVGPRRGPERMVEEAWKEKASTDSLALPEWHSRFQVSFTREERLDALRAGRILAQMFNRPDPDLGGILLEKLRRNDPFTAHTGRWEEGRPAALRLLAFLAPPGMVDFLLPLLKDPPRDGISSDFRCWPEAEALAGRLGTEHLKTLVRWIDAGPPHAHLLLGLLATVEDPGAEALLLKYLDAHAGKYDRIGRANPRVRKPWDTSLRGLLTRPGLSGSRRLLERLNKYGPIPLQIVMDALADRWFPGFGARAEVSPPPVDIDFRDDDWVRFVEAKTEPFTEGETRFAVELKEKLDRKWKELGGK